MVKRKAKKLKVRPIKYRKTVISSKKKLFDRVKNKKKPAKPRVKILVKKKKAAKKHKPAKVKKLIKKKKPVKKIKKKSVHPVKYRKAVISSKKKSFDRVKKIIVKKIKTKKRSKKEKKLLIKQPLNFSAESLFKAKIKVIGVGGGGGSIVSEIGRSLEKATFVIADTDIRALKKRKGIKYFWFGEEFTHGLGTGLDVDLAKQAAESVKEKISNNFKDQDIIIFVASLGGGLGSGATQIFAKAAKEFNGITFGIFTLPFKFEGKNKSKIALKALKELRRLFDVSITISNEKIFKVIDSNTSITQAFSIVNKNLIESLESLIDIIYNPGLINIDFADLRTILKGRGSLAFLNTCEASGKDRADITCKEIFANPLYQNNNFTADKILFNILSGDNLSMLEVEKISKAVADLNPKAKIIFGVSKNSKYKNKIKTTLLMTGPSKDAGLIAPEQELKPVTRAIEEKVEVKKETKEEIKKEKPPKKTRKKSSKKKKSENKEKPPKKEEKEEISLPVPLKEHIFRQPAILLDRKISIEEPVSELAKKAIRRSALDIKKEEAKEEHKRAQQEKEWEIPAFLRRVKFKS